MGPMFLLKVKPAYFPTSSWSPRLHFRHENRGFATRNRGIEINCKKNEKKWECNECKELTRPKNKKSTEIRLKHNRLTWKLRSIKPKSEKERQRIQRPCFFNGNFGFVFSLMNLFKMYRKFKIGELLKNWTPSVGIEPTTTWLKAMRSTGWAKTASTHKLNLVIKNLRHFKLFVAVKENLWNYSNIVKP